MATRHAWRGPAAVVALAFIVVPGCGGPPAGAVSGTVRCDGKPYGGAAVVLMSPKTGGGGTANLDADGRFNLPKPLPPGEYRVYLAPKVAVDSPGGPPTPVKIDTTIPGKYWSESSTDVTVDVKAGANDFTVELSR